MKKLFALILALTIIFSMVPLGVLATEPEAITIETEAPVMLADGDISSGTPDGTPPVLTGMTLSVTTVTAPAEIQVTISATDDVSGVEDAWVHFECDETKKYLSAHLLPEYWDSTMGRYVPYADGNLHGTIKIDQYLEAGIFVLSSIDVGDVAGNYCAYYEGAEEWDEKGNGPLPDTIIQREIIVVDSEVSDGMPPQLISMTLSTTEITAPGTIEVIVSATDDVSGVEDAWVHFECDETKKSLSTHLLPEYWDSTVGKYVPYADGNLHGTIKIDQYLEAGIFVLSSIDVGDVAGNYCAYYEGAEEWDEKGNGPLPDTITQREIHVTDSGSPDGTPPVLIGMTLSATTMTAPGTIEVIISATDDVSGVEDAWVHFECDETKKYLSAHLLPEYWDSTVGKYVPYADGNLHGAIKIDQYLESGTFVLSSIDVGDVAGNYCAYYEGAEEWDEKGNGPLPDTITQREINVLNSVPDVTTSVAKPEFVDQVQDAADDAYIVADFSGETTMPEEVFDAIAGTDKTLDLVSEGVTWRFNGEDITNDSKPIDLNVQITKVEENTSDAGQEIQNKLDETPGVVMKFAENGELPGKATIQVKVDYAMRQYLGTDQKLCVYYYNNQTGKLELVAENLTVLNDTYVEFTITHCSYYILTTELPPETPEEPDTPDTEDVTFGDTDGNGKIQTNDAKLVLQHIVRMPVTLNLDAADVDGNGKIQTNDAKLILQYIVKIITQFPAEKAESSDSWGENQTPPAIRG